MIKPIEKIFPPTELRKKLAKAQEQGQKVVFTNGCFDILHEGHVTYLYEARQAGDLLVMGVNSDASIGRLKGPKRPINPLDERMLILASLYFVDYVASFEEDTPLELITTLQPDLLVKGGDWDIDSIVGREIVEGRGGKVFNLPLVAGKATTGVIERIVERYVN
ncbi:MAG: D-glycero-beta-D-manno-heptose 1-phosphate adenylyltransferase [SAR324 cluster bacterium]|nr:D-glycero-beta-D-manno-heptose 1-phosphate adenylyltransferase [SAR324 cluster bacterium]